MSLEETRLPMTYFFLWAEEEATIGDYMWLLIAASCFGTILLLGAVIVAVYYRRQKRGQQPQYYNTAHGKETGNSQQFHNPVYDSEKCKAEVWLVNETHFTYSAESVCAML